MNLRELPKYSFGSLKKGIWLVFDSDKQNIIKYWASSYSGKEKVFINDVLILEQKNWKTQKETVFYSTGGDEYKLDYKLHNLKAPEYILSRNGNIEGHYKVHINVFKLSPIPLKILIFWFVGLAISALIILTSAKVMVLKYQLPPYIDEVLALVWGILFLFLFFKSRKIKINSFEIIDLLEETNS